MFIRNRSAPPWNFLDFAVWKAKINSLRHLLRKNLLLGAGGLNGYVYTYVIGIVTIRKNEVEITPGGTVSEPASEATPWLEWDKKGNPKITMDGPAVIKGGGKLIAGLINIGNKKKYDIENSIYTNKSKQIEELKNAFDGGFLSREEFEKRLKNLS